MNLVPIILSMSTEPKNMQERLWLDTKWTPRIQNPIMLKLRPKGKTLKSEAPRKMSNLGFYNGTPNSVKVLSPLRKGRLQIPSLIESIHHRQMGRNPSISQTWLVAGERSGRIPLPVNPPRSNRLYTHLIN